MTILRDRNSEFEPEILSKNSWDLSAIEEKVISMYGKGCHSETFQMILKRFMVYYYLYNQFQNKKIKLYHKLNSGKNIYRKENITLFSL